MITLTDLTDRFGEQELAQLTDRENYQVIDMAVVNRAISDAESEVESYLNMTGLVGRNQAGELVYIKSPVMPKPLVIKTCDIARYYLYKNGVTGIVKERYEQAIEWLKLVMRNPAMLTGVSATTGITPTSHSGIVVMSAAPPPYWIE